MVVTKAIARNERLCGRAGSINCLLSRFTISGLYRSCRTSQLSSGLSVCAELHRHVLNLNNCPLMIVLIQGFAQSFLRFFKECQKFSLECFTERETCFTDPQKTIRVGAPLN